MVQTVWPAGGVVQASAVSVAAWATSSVRLGNIECALPAGPRGIIQGTVQAAGGIPRADVGQGRWNTCKVAATRASVSD